MNRKSVFAALALALSLTAQQARVPRAFHVRPNAPPVPESLWDKGTRRVRALDVEGPLFGRTAAKAFATAQKRSPGHSLKMELALFDDVALPVLWTHVGQIEGSSDFVWSGAIPNTEHGQAVLIAGAEGSITANFSKGDGHIFQIRTTDDGVMWVREVDQAELGDELAPMTEPAERDPDLEAMNEPVALAGPAPVIDVMVLYTPAAVRGAGGAQAMQRLVQLGVAETNQGYRNSGVAQQIRLVYMGEIRYTESGRIENDLQRLIAPRDGFMDEAHQLRLRYGADLVSLWTEGRNDACGVAQLMQNAARPDPSRGFSVVSRVCATGYYTFGHELGHNMGATHAREDNTGPGLFNFSYGFKQPGKFRTVMAYDGACRCPRINVWSTVNYRVNGLAAGNLQAQNQTTLNRTGPVVAAFVGAARRDEPETPAAAVLPESAHPYADDTDKTWTYTAPGAASLAVTFDARTYVEEDYDFIVIADAAGKSISNRPFTGSDLAGRTVTVPGPTVRIRLVSDDSITGYGFRVAAIQAR